VREDRNMQDLLADLAAEHASLDDLVAPLDARAWETPTPAAGWTIVDCVAHVSFFDGTAALSATNPSAFEADAKTLMADPSRLDGVHARAHELGGPVLLEEWRSARHAVLAAFDGLDPSTRLPWYGPPMSARSFVTARLMETWAHGEDVADALDVRREPTARLRHVAQIGWRARPFSYRVRGLEVPEGDVFVSLDDGAVEIGDPSSENRVTGPLLDFCLVVTQRRLASDTSLVAIGPLAEEWLPIAQAFAGAATTTDPSRTLSS
jgi:uncharacterized protein (TIGR03084 family)